jgi:Recombinase zinc beta ribbon domain
VGAALVLLPVALRHRRLVRTNPVLVGAYDLLADGSMNTGTATAQDDGGATCPSSRSFATASTSARSTSAAPTTTHPTPPLVDTEVFDKAQRLLADRGDHVSKRASNSSKYLLGGLIVCGHCGKRYVGMSAHGRNHRYRYYTCHTRQR